MYTHFTGDGVPTDTMAPGEPVARPATLHRVGQLGQLRQWASDKFGSTSSNAINWVHVDESAPGPVTEAVPPKLPSWRRWIYIALALVLVLALGGAGAGLAVRYMRPRDSAGRAQEEQGRAPLQKPKVCATGPVTGRQPMLQQQQPMSAATLGGPQDGMSLSSDQEVPINRLMVKFGDDLDTFKVLARREMGTAGGRKLLANTTIPVDVIISIWKKNKPVNGWFNSTSLLPEVLPDQIRDQIRRFFYAAHSGTFILEMDNTRAMKAVKRLLDIFSRIQPGLVEAITEDSLVTLTSTTSSAPPSSGGAGTNDRLSAQQYSLSKVGIVEPKVPPNGEAATEMTSAWQHTKGDPEVVVAVIDTGVDLTHPDLTESLWVNQGEVPDNGIDDDGNGYIDDYHGVNFVAKNARDEIRGPIDDNGHGTHVAGIIAATADNGIGITGVAPAVKVMVLKALDQRGAGRISDMVEAIEYSLKMRVPLTCNSYGGNVTSPELGRIVRSSSAYGQLFIAASGNEGVNNDQDPSFPASYKEPNVISVAATNEQDCLADFSNYGGKSVHLAAPGVSIVSTWPRKSGREYMSGSGTSQATPIVAGTAALMMSVLKRGDPTWAQQGGLVKDLILKTVDPIEGIAPWLISGGRLNAARAVEAMANHIKTNQTTSPGQPPSPPSPGAPTSSPTGPLPVTVSSLP